MSNINTASPQSTQTTEPPAGRWFNSEGGYFQLPRALRFDERLSHTQRVVLMTIASHVIHCDEVFPSREAIRSYTGMDAADITALVASCCSRAQGNRWALPCSACGSASGCGDSTTSSPCTRTRAWAIRFEKGIKG